MTEIILTFPVRRISPLSCVWFETGNPAQPLACRWIENEPATAGSRFRFATHAEACWMCA
jgi:hypothetical protein